MKMAAVLGVLERYVVASENMTTERLEYEHTQDAHNTCFIHPDIGFAHQCRPMWIPYPLVADGGRRAQNIHDAWNIQFYSVQFDADLKAGGFAITVSGGSARS